MTLALTVSPTVNSPLDASLVSDVHPTTKVVNVIRAGHGRALGIGADPASSGVAEELVRKTVAHFGRLDIVVHHPSARVRVVDETTSEADLDAIWGSIYRAGFRLAHHALPVMRESGDGLVLFTGDLEDWPARTGFLGTEVARLVLDRAVELSELGLEPGHGGDARVGPLSGLLVRRGRVSPMAASRPPRLVSELDEALAHLADGVEAKSTLEPARRGR